MRAAMDMTTFRFICFFLLVWHSAVGQKGAIVNGAFEKNRAGIGEIIPYSLTARYPEGQQVLFPDSNYSFKPFEYSSKKYFTTRTKDHNSLDSVVYYLTTFEIDSLQQLKLPVFVLQEKDCVAIFSMPDTLALNFQVASVPDSVSVEKLPLKTNTAYQKVNWILNYPIIVAIVVLLVVALIIVWVVFGKRIRRHFAIRRLNREYKEFMARFNDALDKLSTGFSSRIAEEALIVWKNYMENLEQYPYTKSTSREIIRRVSDGNLDQALKSIDRGIYGGFSSTVEPFRFLQTYSQQRFEKKEAEVKNG
jgi:hypothetical protein